MIFQEEYGYDSFNMVVLGGAVLSLEAVLDAKEFIAERLTGVHLVHAE